MTDVFINGGVALITSIITWILARRKYNVEVDGNELDNLKKQLDIYKDIVEDTRKQLNLYIEMRSSDRQTLIRLQRTIDSLLPLACQIKRCENRKALTDEELIIISGGQINERENS